MLRMLGRALEKWKKLDPKDRLMANPPPRNPEGRRRLEDQYPEGGLVLQQFSRDLPRAGGQGPGRSPGWTAGAWNLDFAWFTAEEARSMVPASRETGSRHAVPEKLVRRLACRHLLDNVRGETSSFRNEHVQKAELGLTLAKVEGDLLHFTIEGATRAVEKGKWQLRGWHEAPVNAERGYEPRLLGRASYDAKAGKFTAFDLVAVGPRWGGTTYNVRADDLGPHPMGVYFRLAETAEGPDRVAPAHAREYFR